jgi:hypothetical protein
MQGRLEALKRCATFSGASKRLDNYYIAGFAGMWEHQFNTELGMGNASVETHSY